MAHHPLHDPHRRDHDHYWSYRGLGDIKLQGMFSVWKWLPHLITNPISVGLLCIWNVCLPLGCLDCHLDRSQTRRRYRSRRLQDLSDLWCLDHLPMVLVPNRMGTFGGWKCHCPRLRGCLLWHPRPYGEASIRRSPSLGSS